MAGTLHLQVISGLGSRVRAVLGAIAYCQANGKELLVDWPTRDPADPWSVQGVSLEELWSGPFRVTNSNSRWVMKECANRHREHLPEIAGNIKVRTDSPGCFLNWFSQPWRNYWEQLTPTPLVCSVRDALTPTQGSPVLGVHVRKECPPQINVGVEWFLERSSQFPKHWRIYLATDHQSVVDAFCQRFGERVIHAHRACRPDGGAIYDRGSIATAAAEWYILASCRWFIGSAGSSYSELAALFRGADKIGPVRLPRPNLAGGRHESPVCPPDEMELTAALSGDAA